MESVERAPNTWVAQALAYWVVGTLALAAGTVALAWLIGGLLHGFAGGEDVAFFVVVFMMFRVLIGVVLGFLFIAIAAVARPRGRNFHRTMIVVGACVGALSGAVGWFSLWYLVVPFTCLGAAYGAFVGARVADLRRS